MPVRLAEHGDAKAGRLEHTMEDRHGEAGMIDIRVASYEDDIDSVPAARFHLSARSRRQRGGEGLVPHRQSEAHALALLDRTTGSKCSLYRPRRKSAASGR